MYIHRLKDLILYGLLTSATRTEREPLDALLVHHPWLFQFHRSMHIASRHLYLLGGLSRRAVPDRRHFHGTVISNPSGYANALTFHTPQGPVTVGLDGRTVCQKNYFADGEAIHVIARRIQGRYMAELVTDGETYALADPLEELADQRRVLEEFLSLPPAQQQAVFRFFRDEVFACRFLNFLSYAASTDRDLTQEEEISSLIAEYQLFFGSGEDPDDWGCELFTALLQAMEAEEELAFPSKDALEIPPMLVFLKTYAAVNGFLSPDDDGSPVHTLLGCPEKQLHLVAVAMGKLCTAQRFGVLLSEACRLCSPTDGPPGRAEQLLCSLLESGIPLSRLDLELICDSLFHDRICVRYMNAIADGLSGPNGPGLEEYLSYRFRKGLRQDKLEFYNGAAAIFLIRSHRRHVDPLQEAQAQILHSRTREDRLLGLFALNLGLWYHRARNQKVTFRPSPELLRSLKLWLGSCEKSLYHGVLSAAQELILGDCADGAELDGFEIRLRLLDHLTKPDYRGRAQRLLALLPPDPTGAMGRQLLCKEYLDRYGSAGLEDSVVLFGICANLHCWNLLGQSPEEEFLRLCHSIRREPEKVSEEGLLFLEKLRRYWMPRLFPAADTDLDASAMLFEPLDKSVREFLDRRCAKSALDVAATPGEAAAILAYLDAICPQTNANYPTADFGHASVLITATDLAAENCGSGILTKWFYHLCRFGCGERAIEFYDAHQDILDRPYCYSRTSRHLSNSQTRDFLQFLNKRTRLAEGLCIAIRAGQNQVLEAFLHSKFRGPVIRPNLVRGLASGLTRSQRACMERLYEGVYAPDTFLDRPAMDLTAPEQECMYWYDDRGVLAQYLVRQPDTHKTIFTWGYRSDRQLALSALGCRGESLALLSHTLRKDLSLCRLAIQTAPAAVSYADETVLRQTDQIMPLLLGKRFSLEHLPESYRDDKQIVLSALAHDSSELRFASSRLRADRQVVLAAVSHTSAEVPYFDLPIRWADPAFSDDEELILTAARYNPASVRFASPQLRESPAIRQLLASIGLEKEPQ